MPKKLDFDTKNKKKFGSLRSPCLPTNGYPRSQGWLDTALASRGPVKPDFDKNMVHNTNNVVESRLPPPLESRGPPPKKILAPCLYI